MKTKHPPAFLPLNRVAVTPTFQSARFAGRKTGASGAHLLMALMRVHCARLFIVLALAVAVECARAQGTAFTYQGELTYSGALANGVFDLQFTIYAANSGGSALAGPVTRNAVGLSNGVFTVLLDFGAGIFTGADRWVEIGARTNGGTFSTLAPRQPLTPAPYAITAANVVSGGIPAGTYASPVTFNNTSNSFNGAFTGNGAGLTGLTSSTIGSGQVVKSVNGLNDAVTLSAGANITLTPSGNNIQIAASGGAGGGWSLAGNAGTAAGANFIGTTDGQALELKVNGTRALRLEPNTNGAPNLIGGSPVNFVAPGRVGAVIAGGGATNYSGSVLINSVSGDFGTIGGGQDNTIETSASNATIGGGLRNMIQTNAGSSTIGGGIANTIQTGGGSSTIGGGVGNTIQTNAFRSTIGGGQNNKTAALQSTIGGGIFNTIQTNAFDSTISGGNGNTIETGATLSTIGGGLANSVSGNRGTVPGGQNNVAGAYSFAAGLRAKATHTGSFVWADSMQADFATTDTNQFLIRASGGVGIGTNNPSAKLHVAGDQVIVSASGVSAALGSGAFRVMNSAQTAGLHFDPNDIACIGSSIFALNGANDCETRINSTVFITTNQLVGIGRTDPASALDVNGEILVNRTSSSSPGYAFRDDANTGMFSTLPNHLAFATASTDRLHIESSGNVGIGTNNPSQKLHVVGNILASGTVNGGSDRNAKENFAPVHGRTVLDQVVALPISRWNYKTEADVTHLGPMAQDFHSAFAVGLDDKHISMVDADGVALAAIQGLNQKLHEELKRRDAENAELKKSVEELKAIVGNLARTQGEPR